MKTTSAFEESVVDFLRDVRDEFPDSDVTREYVMDVAGVFTENGRCFNGANHAIVSVADHEEMSFFYKFYVDPLTHEDCYAAEDEEIVEWADSVDDPEFQDALLSENPPAHVVTYNDDPEGPRYLAVCNGCKGHVETHAFDDLRQACGFAWGMSLDEITRAQSMSWGHIREDAGVVCPCDNDTRDGFSYKNGFAFAMKTDQICYIPEHEFDGTQPLNEYQEYALADLGEFSDGKVGYTYQDIVDICLGNEKVAEAVFEMCRWAGPSAEYEQLEDWEIAEIIAGVDAHDHTLLDYLGEDYKGIPWPVYQDVQSDTLLAYCSTDPTGAPLNLSRLFVLKDEGNTPLTQVYEPEHEVRFVSTRGLELPKCARVHNVHMQEKGTFGGADDPVAVGREMADSMEGRGADTLKNGLGDDPR